MGVRAVFLDFGGTLVRSVPDSYAGYAWVFREFGVEVSREEWADADRRVWPRVASSLYSSLGQTPSFWDKTHSEMLRELNIPDPGGRIHSALHQRFVSPELHAPFPETEDVLRELHRERVSVHIISNNTDSLLETISRLGWEDRFETVTFSQEAGAEKPDPRVFSLALKRAGVEPAEALHVGDSWEADYLGAIRVGMRGLWLNRLHTPAPAPCEMIEDLRGLRSALPS
jgi:HAD superfamily hydrolase (TIGR01509 family)